HLWHMAGLARAARDRARDETGLDSARPQLARELSKRRWRLGRNLCHLRRSFRQRKRRQHRFANCLGYHGNLRLWRSQSAKCATRVALSLFDATARRFLARTANHRDWFPWCLLPEVRYVSAEFPAARARHLRELSPRSRSSAEFFPLQLIARPIEIAVIPGRVEGSRRVTLKVSQRD